MFFVSSLKQSAYLPILLIGLFFYCQNLLAQEKESDGIPGDSAPKISEPNFDNAFGKIKKIKKRTFRVDVNEPHNISHFQKRMMIYIFNLQGEKLARANIISIKEDKGYILARVKRKYKKDLDYNVLEGMWVSRDKELSISTNPVAQPATEENPLLPGSSKTTSIFLGQNSKIFRTANVISGLNLDPRVTTQIMRVHTQIPGDFPSLDQLSLRVNYTKIPDTEVFILRSSSRTVIPVTLSGSRIDAGLCYEIASTGYLSDYSFCLSQVIDQSESIRFGPDANTSWKTSGLELSLGIGFALNESLYSNANLLLPLEKTSIAEDQFNGTVNSSEGKITDAAMDLTVGTRLKFASTEAFDMEFEIGTTRLWQTIQFNEIKRQTGEWIPRGEIVFNINW